MSFVLLKKSKMATNQLKIRPVFKEKDDYISWKNESPLRIYHLLGRNESPLCIYHLLGRNESPLCIYHLLGRNESPLCIYHLLGRNEKQPER